MTVAGTLLDKAKERRSIPTDMALAARVGRTRQAIAQWRSGAKHPDDEMLCELAKLADVDVGPYLVAAQAERSHGEVAKKWAALARQLGGIAAVLAVVAMIPVSYAKEVVGRDGFEPSTSGLKVQRGIEAQQGFRADFRSANGQI